MRQETFNKIDQWTTVINKIVMSGILAAFVIAATTAFFLNGIVVRDIRDRLDEIVSKIENIDAAIPHTVWPQAPSAPEPVPQPKPPSEREPSAGLQPPNR